MAWLSRWIQRITRERTSHGGKDLMMLEQVRKLCDVKSPCMNVFTNTFMAGLIAMAWATPWKSMSFDPSPAAVLL